MEDPLMGEEGPPVLGPGGEGPEAVVETVEERFVPHIEPPIQPLSYLEYTWYTALNYFSNPWALLILLYLLYRVYRLVSPMVTEPLADRYAAWQEQRQEQEEAAALKKDPDAYRARMEGMEAARRGMQARHDEAAMAEQERREAAEERRREQDIKDWEEHQHGGGYKNRAQPRVDKEREALENAARVKGKKGYSAPKSDYNPMMGGGGGGGFRPAARRGGGG